MLQAIWRKIVSFLWWTYPRGSLEYDIMVSLILAFIFLTPRTAFRDQPQILGEHPVAVQVVSSAHQHQYMILGARPDASRDDLQRLLEKYVGHAVKIHEIKTVGENADTPQFYNVWTE